MITDITGVELTPGNQGSDCLGNGEHSGIDCCCDECDYAQCCKKDFNMQNCLICADANCPRSQFS